MTNPSTNNLRALQDARDQFVGDHDAAMAFLHTLDAGSDADLMTAIERHVATYQWR